MGGTRGDDLWSVGEEALRGDDGDGVGSLPNWSGSVGVGVVGGGDQGGGRSRGNVAGESGLFGEVGGLSSGNLHNKMCDNNRNLCTTGALWFVLNKVLNQFKEPVLLLK